jgi:glycerol-3-phosphate acyltransferase PlsX
MGADEGPEEMVRGGLIWAAKDTSSRLVLVGHSDRVKEAMLEIDDLPENISTEHAETEVPMKVSATDGVRMRDSSIAVGLRMVKEGRADAFVSPGNTGAVMATSLLTLGRIKGVLRPAIAAVFPTSTGLPTVVLDVGANAECKPNHLSQFAVMGSVYSSVILGIETPRVGLLSIGEERSKGNELTIATRKILSRTDLNFVGNIEGRDILSGTVHVAVTDGFTGNILLKFAESIKPMLVTAVQRQVRSNIFSRFGVWLMLPFLRRMRGTFDYARAGGAPLLGVNGDVIICHGASSARAISNGMQIAADMVKLGIRHRIQQELMNNHSGKENGSSKKGSDIGNGVVHPAGSDNQR